MSKNKRNKNVGGGVEEKAAETFANEGDANAALSKTATILNMAEKQKEKAAKAPKVAKDGRVKLPPLPRGASKSKPLVPCGCGCPLMTRSKFAPGHDSRLRGWALRIARNMIKLDDIVSVYECSTGERDAVEAFVKQLKKEGKWEALKTPQVPVKKAVSE